MKNSPKRPFPSAVTLQAVALRTAGFSLLWWILAEGRFEDLGFIIGCVAVAVTVSVCLWPPGAWRCRPLGLIRFVPYFLWRSLQGGIDVARRAFAPSMPLQPEVITVPLGSSESQNLLLTWIVSLLPGTAGIRLEEDNLKAHVLDSRLPVRRNIEELRDRLARLCD